MFFGEVLVAELVNVLSHINLVVGEVGLSHFCHN